MTQFALSAKDRMDAVISRLSALKTVSRDDLCTIKAMADIAELARWILAHASMNENNGQVQLRMIIDNPHVLTVEALFLKAAKANPL